MSEPDRYNYQVYDYVQSRLIGSIGGYCEFSSIPMLSCIRSLHKKIEYSEDEKFYLSGYGEFYILEELFLNYGIFQKESFSMIDKVKYAKEQLSNPKWNERIESAAKKYADKLINEIIKYENR